MTGRVSWVDSYGDRLFGTFLRWDGEFAICRRHNLRCRIHKSNLTFEAG